MTSHYRIHPAVGVARMGNSADHFIGPETPGVPGNWDDANDIFKSFREETGKIRRQGARFRVYEYTQSDDGKLISPNEVAVGGRIKDIEWRVHLANRKASFYAFHGQLGANDFYAARQNTPASQIIPDSDPQRTNLRNATVANADRTSQLDIDPGEQLISQRNSATVELENKKSSIPIKSLGTLLLDEAGRLIVLGGYGESNSTASPPRQIDDYANNDTWFDDASDGSVKARIIFDDGSFIDADPAWVLIGPPKFAPAIGNVVTLHDTLWDTAVREIDLPLSMPSTPMLDRLREQKNVWQTNNPKSLKGFKPSFSNEIYPILKRALGAREVHSPQYKENYHLVSFADWGKLSALSGANAQEGKRLREGVFKWLRDPDSTVVQWKEMPRGLGDNYTVLDNNPLAPAPDSFLSLTRIQYAMLREWADGNFIDDWGGSEPVFSSKANPTPDDLDFAAAQNCVGGPFYPGIEVSWMIRFKEIYSEPFRMKIPKEPQSDTTQPVTIGTLEFRPGFFSQQMAIPWQADFYDCHKEEHSDADGNSYYFMWWTAQRPDDVYPSGSTEQVRWVRAFNITDEDGDNNRFTQMQARWFELKFVSIMRNGHWEEEA